MSLHIHKNTSAKGYLANHRKKLGESLPKSSHPPLIMDPGGGRWEGWQHCTPLIDPIVFLLNRSLYNHILLWCRLKTA